MDLLALVDDNAAKIKQFYTTSKQINTGNRQSIDSLKDDTWKNQINEIENLVTRIKNIPIFLDLSL